MEQHKYNYGIIGNCAYLALIDDKANVGWMCWPKFDSSFVFGTLLDDEKGGSYSVRPEWDTYQSQQSYIYNTNVLETIFECEDGSYKVIDYAPRFINKERMFKPLMLFRKIVPLSGNPRIIVTCDPRGNYGKITPEKVFGSSHIRYQGLDQQVRLTTDIPLSFIDSEQPFVLNKTKYLVLTHGIPLEGPIESTAENFLDRTIDYWQNWVTNTSTEKFHQDAVIRSALTLKLHQYQDTGAIIAASTTSLPEYPGSTRNWDYRYCWIRDAHYTLKALNDLSHFKILEEYAGYIQNIALNEQGRIRPLFKIGIAGDPVEKILPLKGYRGERPVRVGNQAYEHVQNDVYGQVLVTLLPLFVDKRLLSNDQSGLHDLVMHCLRMIEETMQEPDNGLWEFRGTSQLHCYTFLFHWAGSQAAVKIAKQLGDKDMQILAEQLIEESAEMIERCYDEERGVYTQAAGVANLDASLLQLINMGYLDSKSEKAKKHLKVLEDALKTESGLFYRYIHEDDFGTPESTFVICAFWYVEALARMDRLDEAVEIFETLLEKGTNHLGLLSEDIHEKTGSQWGNFPQLYSHVGLVNAAFIISKKLDKPWYMD